jgi:hypothetical protein
MMRLSVTTGDPTAIQAKLHIQVLDTNVVDQLVKTSLQECRVDRTNWRQALA